MIMKQIADMTIEDIIARKTEARTERARLSFGQKVQIAEAMRERLAPFNAMRERKKLKDKAP
jgi:hypothetical protein